MRPHLSCNYMTLNEAHLQLSSMPKRWKNYIKYFCKKELEGLPLKFTTL